MREVSPEHSQIIQLEDFKNLRPYEVKMALQYYMRNKGEIKSKFMMNRVMSGVMSNLSNP